MERMTVTNLCESVPEDKVRIPEDKVGKPIDLGMNVQTSVNRKNVAKQVPEKNSKTHFDAGDERAKEYSGLLKSNDPVSFKLVLRPR
ncbi:hypothetical protein E2562_020145 [Oryza meyeriana var. granulata]|uniref:Uncharacterized protein n=1 Tax=Oryza meyeriana var. granulata TaxID=110450 RepID=A0A6G1BNF3_9ORYZ|nr:hypothetical protein E2562_020145 [Oryza meyeriana var. granulata]